MLPFGELEAIAYTYTLLKRFLELCLFLLAAVVNIVRIRISFVQNDISCWETPEKVIL